MSLTSLLAILEKAKGWRTYAAALASVLTEVAGFIGLLPTERAHQIALALGGLAAVFLRASHATTMAEIKDLLSKTSAVLLIGFVLAMASTATAGDRPDVPTSMQLSEATRNWFRNPDGSCVQCSISMAGVHCNNLNAATLLWDSPYGPAVRGGSWPSRVEQYCDQRGIRAWSVTGNTVDDTLPWMTWAAKTGRFAAMGAGRSHFQTLYGYEPGSDRPWLVCNNNSPSRIDRYGDQEFRALHAASGPWVVVLTQPSSDPPTLVKWWR